MLQLIICKEDYMITLQEMLDRLNQLTLRYNLTWSDIKYDADKAIAKINAFMGTTYPKLSHHLISPESTYTVNVDGVQQEIIPEEYIHSIVIPFIAMEVLARDEEFTTIYNKYAAEVEDGLFTMFQKEFNRVPLVFRQNPDQGVFFSPDSALGVIQRNDTVNLPVFKFRVHYHINNDDIVLSTGTALSFVEDTQAYLYGEVATVMGWNIDLLSFNGNYAYTFVGWSRNKAQVTEAYIEEGATLEMISDVHLYANWTRTSVLSITSLGEVSIKDQYKPSLTYLAIPDTVNNIPVRKIASNFVMDSVAGGTRNADNLDVIILPKYLDEIKMNAFKNFKGSAIHFYEGPGAQDVAIRTNAFIDTPNLYSIIVPTNVMTIDYYGFPAVSNKPFTIYCRFLEQNKPSGWNVNWYQPSTATYTVDIMWGYNFG